MRPKISQVCILLFLSLILIGQTGYAQEGPVTRPGAMIEVFNQHFPDYHRKKIQGRIYVNLYQTVKEHQFYDSKTTRPGILFYASDTVFCRDMLYDIYRDKILVYQADIHAFNEVNEMSVKRFILPGHDHGEDEIFIRGELEKNEPGFRSSGFLRIIAEGESYSLYKKYYKVYTTYEDQGLYRVKFVPHEVFVFRSGTRYFTVRNTRDLLEHFPSDAKAIKKILRKSRIRIQNANDEEARQVMVFLEEICKDAGKEEVKE